MRSAVTVGAGDDGKTRSYASMSGAYRAYVLGLMVVIYGFSYADRTLAGVLTPLIKADLKLTDTQLGLINGTAFAFIFGITAVPFGWFADQFSRTRIVGGALVFWSASTFVFGLGASAAHLLLSRAGVGFGEAAGASASHSLLVDYFPYSQRARVLAIYGFGGPVGVAAGAVVGGWISGFWGWRAAFLLAGGTGVFLAILFKLTVQEPVRVVREGESSVPDQFLRSIRIMLGKPGYILICAGCTVGGVAEFAKYFWLSSYMMRSFGVSIAEVTLMFGIIQLVGGIGGGAIGGFVSDRLARTNPGAPALVSAAGYLISCPLLVGILIASDDNMAWTFFFLCTISSRLGTGPLTAAVQHFAGPRLRGTASAILIFCLLILAMGVGVPLIGVLSDGLRQSYGDESLRYALLVLPSFYLTGGLLCAVAARWMTTIPREIESIEV